MKFASKLTAHITPEWRKQYIDYEGLKEFLLTYVDKKTRDQKTWEMSFIEFLDDRDVEFLDSCTTSLQKVDAFFCEKLAEAKRKYISLVEELEDFCGPEVTKRGIFRGSYHKRSESAAHREYVEDTATEMSSKTNVNSNGVDFSSVQFSSVAQEGSLHGWNEYEQDSQLRQRRPSSHYEPHKFPGIARKRRRSVRKLGDLKLAFQEFYLSLVLLQNYQVLNFTGFRKILKKHDKLFRRNNGLLWREQNVDGSEFNTNREIDVLITKIEDMYANKLEHGNKKKTMKRLRVPPISERNNPKSIFLTGFFAGAFLVEAIVIILTYFMMQPLPDNYFPAFRIFRTTFLLIFHLFLLGLNTYGWRSSGVNHVLIFEINPRNHLDHYQLLQIALMLADLWGCAVLYFMYSVVLGVPGYVSPLLLVVVLLLGIFNPFRFGQHRARRWLLRILLRNFCAPFYRVKFADFWLADQLNSLSFVFPEIGFILCFYTSQISWSQGEGCQCSGLLFGMEPLLRILPAWFRFAQCMRRYYDQTIKSTSPHLLNAGKYSCSFLTLIFTIWYGLDQSYWIFAGLVIAQIVQSIATYAWDVRNDWGLFERHTTGYPLLRDETVYHHCAYYYFSIVEDLVLRFAWAVRIALERTTVSQPELLNTIFQFFEVIRRFVWNFFRLENEHLNNCGEFRAVRDIFIRPAQRETTSLINHSSNNNNNNHHHRHHNHRSGNGGKLRRVLDNGLKPSKNNAKGGESSQSMNQRGSMTATKGRIRQWFHNMTRTEHRTEPKQNMAWVDMELRKVSGFPDVRVLPTLTSVDEIAEQINPSFAEHCDTEEEYDRKRLSNVEVEIQSEIPVKCSIVTSNSGVLSASALDIHNNSLTNSTMSLRPPLPSHHGIRHNTGNFSRVTSRDHLTYTTLIRTSPENASGNLSFSSTSSSSSFCLSSADADAAAAADSDSSANCSRSLRSSIEELGLDVTSTLHQTDTAITLLSEAGVEPLLRDPNDAGKNLNMTQSSKPHGELKPTFSASSSCSIQIDDFDDMASRSTPMEEFQEPCAQPEAGDRSAEIESPYPLEIWVTKPRRSPTPPSHNVQSTHPLSDQTPQLPDDETPIQ